MNTARFAYVARQMAPHRTAVAVDERTDGQTISLDCGHTLKYVPHVWVKVGSKEHACSECGRIAARKLPEFAS